MANFKNDPCVKCNTYRIYNKTYKLCRVCNFERINPGLKFKDHTQIKMREYKEKQKKKIAEKMTLTMMNPDKKICQVDSCMNKVFSKKLCYHHYMNTKKNEKKIKDRSERINSKTNQQLKEEAVKKELSLIKRESKLQHSINKDNVCDGCLRKKKALDYSHILSVGQRKDLELHKDNKNLLCRDCHNKWESNDPDEMLKLACFYENMKFIRKMDEQKFWKIYFKFNDRMMISECNQLEQIDDWFKSQNK